MIEYVQGWNSPGHLKWENMAFSSIKWFECIILLWFDVGPSVWGFNRLRQRCPSWHCLESDTEFFFVVSCLFVKFCVVSGIIFGKEFRKIYWTLHQVGLPSVSLCWFWFHCPAQSRYKYKDLEELEIYQLETQLLVVSKNLQVESERGTWWNIGCGRSSCAFEADSWCRVFSIFFALIFGGSTVSNVQNAAKLFQLTFVWHAKLQIVVAAKTSNDAKGSFCRHIT